MVISFFTAQKKSESFHPFLIAGAVSLVYYLSIHHPTQEFLKMIYISASWTILEQLRSKGLLQYISLHYRWLSSRKLFNVVTFVLCCHIKGVIYFYFLILFFSFFKGFFLLVFFLLKYVHFFSVVF
jgi:hypothetical protein